MMVWKFGRCFSFSRGVFSGSMLIFPGVWNIYLHERWKMAKNFEVTNPYKSLTVIKQPLWIFQLHPMPRETRNSRTAFVFSFGAEKKFSAQFSWWSIFIDPVWRLLVYSSYSSSSFCCSYAILCVDLDCTETMILPCLNLIAGLRAVKVLTRMILGKKKHHRIPNQLAINFGTGFLLVGFDVTISNWDHLNDSKKPSKSDPQSSKDDLTNKTTQWLTVMEKNKRHSKSDSFLKKSIWRANNGNSINWTKT